MDSSRIDMLKMLLEAVTSTKYLASASFVLLLYDHLICLDQEFEFFWKGEWSLTRVFYFLNRYIPPLVFIIHLSSFHQMCLSICIAAARVTASSLVLGMCIVEALLMIRVYFLWSHSRPVRWSICGIFVAGAAAAIALAGKSIHNLGAIRLASIVNQPGCIIFGNDPYWPIFVPTIVVQTVLFLATICRVHRPLVSGTNKIVTFRLLRDGGIFYCATLVSVAFATSGSVLVDRPNLAMPALLSNYLLAVQSTCASHLILSIHSLAADIGRDPIFLLSNIEISRIDWRPGQAANELIVDLGDCESPYPDTLMELVDLDPLAKEGDRTQGKLLLRATRIGMLHRNNSQVDLAARAPTRYQPSSVDK